MSFREQQLVGDNAFYKREDYEARTKIELSSKEPLEACYSLETESRCWRITKLVLSIIVFPIGLYYGFHSLLGRVALISSFFSLFPCVQSKLNASRSEVLKYPSDWKYKRIAVEVDGYTIDAVIVGKEKTFDNGRWILRAGGNGEFYEKGICPENSSGLHLAEELEANAIFFNYPGVGASSGCPSRSAMVKAHEVMLKFLEDKEKGIGATQIVSFGYSMGGGAQNDVLNTHELKEDIKYVFVKDRTFSTVAAIFEDMLKFLGFLPKIFGWNVGSEESSKIMKAPEIILQTAHVEEYTILTSSDQLKDDGIITANASLAKDILDNNMKNKTVIGIPEGHHSALTNLGFLALAIRKDLGEEDNLLAVV